MADNPLRRLEALGQSIWLDAFRRAMLTSGELKRLIDEDGLSGVTANPSILEKAIAGSHDYDTAVQALARQRLVSRDIYESLAVEDLRDAADLFRAIYDRTGGQDGFVSLEVSPGVAHDTQATLAEAHRLWAALERPNVMIKVPATAEGIPAIQQLISEGINVNITLLFGLDRYRQVVEAYLSGLETRVRAGQPVKQIASVASFFLSRIDVLLDPRLPPELKGQVAIASARAAYAIYRDVFSSERFQKLGANKQRLLWASTSTKDPSDSDVKYVEPLIGPDTINTLPLSTLQAYRDHGDPAPRLSENLAEAQQVLARVTSLGIDLNETARHLEEDGVKKFSEAFDRLVATLDQQTAEHVDAQKLDLGSYAEAVQRRVQALEQNRFMERLWRKDASLWKSDADSQQVIRDALGWLHVPEVMDERVAELQEFVSEVRAAGFQRVVHMGMGGSSLAPLVFARSFAQPANGLPLTVLDTTDPATIATIEQAAPLDKTLFIVASKSGTTAEPAAFGDYFFDRVRHGHNFVAITDPGTLLERQAKERGFRKVFCNFADIGGRYSALSYFGLVPVALFGIDVNELLQRTLRMLHACSSCIECRANPGLQLGATLGELATQHGRDKVTLLMPDSLSTLGLWLEQLIAESTGKDGTGLVPIAEEPVGEPGVYGDDRAFAYIRPANETGLDRAVDALRQAGQPLVTLDLNDLLDVGQEFYRWEIATAVAGGVLGINAFDQPNVQESKDNTNRLLAEVRETGRLPSETPTVTSDAFEVYGGDLRDLLEQVRPGDYIAFGAYLTEDAATDRALTSMRLRLRERLRVATTAGYGPRYLHSTGQLHKGGPKTGLFLQIVQDDGRDVKIPGQPYSFSILKQAQSLGDLQSLTSRRLPVVRVTLGRDPAAGWRALTTAVRQAVK